jgi:hypothetical protein
VVYRSDVDRQTCGQAFDNSGESLAVRFAGCCELKKHSAVVGRQLSVTSGSSISIDSLTSIRRRFLKTINPILAMINKPPTPVCGGSVSPKTIRPTITAISGVTSEIIIAFVDSILLNNH